MRAYLALALALVAPAFSATRDRLGRLDRPTEVQNHEDIQGPRLLDYILSEQYLAAQKTNTKLITKPRPDEPVAEDNVIVESNVVRIVPAKSDTDNEVGDELVRERRGYNLENVRVPARYPYLPVPNYNRLRRWGW